MIGVTVPTLLRSERVTRQIKRSLGLPFAMDIIILMCWSIWKEKMLGFLTLKIHHQEKCKIIFKQEFAMLIKRTKKHYVNEMEQWLHDL
jgi:hypothetical protein